MAWLLVGLVFFLVLWVVADTLRWGISPMPTLGRARQTILKQLSPLQEGVILEMGAGWGGLALALAEQCPQARIVAYEGAWIPWMVGWLRCRVSRHRARILWVRCDFFLASWPEETQVVVCYLFPGAMRRLADELPKRLSAGTFVISHAFALPRWEAEQAIYLPDLFRTPVYLYRIPTHSTEPA